MWEQLNAGADYLLVKYSRQNDRCIIKLTNLINIWGEEILSSCLIQRCKDQNPLIEADDESLIQHIFSLLGGRKKDILFRSSLNEENRTLEIKTKLAGVAFNITFRLKLQNSEILFQEVTQPLLRLAQHLFTTQKTLCDLLEAKDAEIEEYKAEGAQLKRRKLETEPFNREEYIGNNDLLTSMIFFSSKVPSQDSAQEENCARNSGNVPVKCEDFMGPGETQESNMDAIQDFESETQISQPTKIKMEQEVVSEQRNTKKHKSGNKPKLCL